MIYGVAEHLPKNKYDITILHPSEVNRQGKTLEDHDNIRIEYFPSRFLGGVNYTIPRHLNDLLKLFSMEDFETIHVGDYFYPTSIPPILSKVRACKLLSVNAMPGYDWRFGEFSVDLMAKIYTYSIGKKILSSYDKIIVLYTKLFEDLVRFGINEEKIFILPNGMDIKRFKTISEAGLKSLRNTLGIDEEEKVILFVGRLVRVKRVDMLIYMAKKFHDEGLKIKTVVVGDGPCRGELELLAKEICGDVIFTGWRDESELSAYYGIANLVVLPSVSEGLPNVLLEAGAFERPCIAFNTNGVKDIIIHGKTGFIIENNDFKSFYQHIKFLLFNDGLRENMGKNAAKHIEDKFNWDNIVRKYESLIQVR